MDNVGTGKSLPSRAAVPQIDRVRMVVVGGMVLHKFRVRSLSQVCAWLGSKFYV